MKCSQCPCQIDNTKFPLPRAEGKVVCQCCYELWSAIHARAYFIVAQNEWILEMRKLDLLRIGEDSLTELPDEDDPNSTTQ